MIRWREMTVLPAAVLNDRTPQHAPRYYRPVWHVGHLVYQGGIPLLPDAPINGGGFLPAKDGYRGKEGNAWWLYSSPVTSQVGGGSLPARPNFLTALFGGRITTGQ
jgi:hypothetical protein